MVRQPLVSAWYANSLTWFSVRPGGFSMNTLRPCFSAIVTGSCTASGPMMM